MRLSALIVVCAVSSAAQTAIAQDRPLSLGGRIRSQSALLEPTDSTQPMEASALGNLRLALAAHATEWLSAEVHAIQDLNFPTGPGVISPGVIAGAQRFRTFRLSKSAEAPAVRSTFDIDRVNARIAAKWFDLTIGRQVINFSKAYFWSPFDVFLPFAPGTIDREYKPGVDAVRFDVPIGDFSGFNLVAAMGPTITLDSMTGVPVADDAFARASYYGSAIIGRAFFNVEGFDIAVQGGKAYGGYQIAAGFAGDVASLFGARGEGSFLFAIDGPNTPVVLVKSHGRAVLGVERRFESGLYLTGEYFYNGAGEPNDLATAFARFASGETVSLTRHLVGLLVDYPIGPTVDIKVATTISLSDGSVLFAPALSISIASNATFEVGDFLTRGAHPELAVLKSEFGSFPNVFYAALSFYF